MSENYTANEAPQLFPTTRWTLLKRVRAGTEQEARQALDTLCRCYWKPIYCLARKRGLPSHDAQDAVQGFFECLLRRELFSTAEESAGLLRQLLQHAFDRYCTQQWQKANRQKRGCGAEHIELRNHFDIHSAEQSFLKSNASHLSLDEVYNREWATALLQRSLEALREDYIKRGWKERYDILVKSLLQQEDAERLTALAELTGTTASNLRVTLHRMRTHFRDKIEREVATTLDTDDPQLIQQEIKELMKVFS